MGKNFADKVFPAIDENIFSVLYSKKASRPNTPVNVIVGALILKEALNVTDDEIVEAMAFDIRYQYALHTTSLKSSQLVTEPSAGLEQEFFLTKQSMMLIFS